MSNLIYHVQQHWSAEDGEAHQNNIASIVTWETKMRRILRFPACT